MQAIHHALHYLYRNSFKKKWRLCQARPKFEQLQELKHASLSITYIKVRNSAEKQLKRICTIDSHSKGRDKDLQGTLNQSPKSNAEFHYMSASINVTFLDIN